MWRKIYDVEKTEEDLKNLSEKMDLGEMSKVLTDIRLLENSINEILPEIQKKKEEMLKLQQSKYDLEFDMYKNIMIDNVNKLGTHEIEALEGEEVEKYGVEIRNYMKKINEERVVRNFFDEQLETNDLLKILKINIPQHKAYTLQDLQSILEKLVINLRYPERIERYKTCDYNKELMQSPFASSSSLNDSDCFPRVHRIEYVIKEPKLSMFEEEIEMLKSIRDIEEHGDPNSYVLEKQEMHDRVLDILESKEHNLLRKYNEFLLSEMSSGFEEFWQIWTLFQKSKKESLETRKSDISACSRALLKALTLLGKIEKDNTEEEEVQDIIQTINDVMSRNEECKSIDDVFSYEIGDLFKNYVSFALNRHTD